VDLGFDRVLDWAFWQLAPSAFLARKLSSRHLHVARTIRRYAFRVDTVLVQVARSGVALHLALDSAFGRAI
jgi:hypothetical protein